jgi:arsenical pump membrane protein
MSLLAATLLIFVATLTLIMLRPFGITEGASALLGAALMLLVRSLSPTDAVLALRGQWNVYGFFLGLMTISALADRAGVFDWMAYQAGRWAGGSALRLYLAVFAIGSLITTFQSNDATALILTPIVFALVTRLGLAVVPFMFACTFIADTASFVLPVSNPTNILVLDAFGMDLAAFWRHLLLPSIFCIIANTAAFVLIFWKDLRQRYAPGAVRPPHLRDVVFFRYTLAVLAGAGAAYIAAAALGLPLSFVALAAAGLLVLGAHWRGLLEWPALRRDISWSLFAFITGMFLVVRAMENVGLTAALGRTLLTLAGSDPAQASLVTAAGTALGANMINNVPMTMVMISTLNGLDVSGALRQVMVHATIFGAALGPNLTTVGSLATMLWIVILRRKGLEISPRTYLRLGVAVVPGMIVVGALLIALSA